MPDAILVEVTTFLEDRTPRSGRVLGDGLEGSTVGPRMGKRNYRADSGREPVVDVRTG